MARRSRDRGCGPHRSSDGRIRLAAVLDREDVESIGGSAVTTVVRVAWDDGVDDLRATTERVLDALVLEAVRTSAPAGPETAAVLVAHVVSTGLAPLGWSDAARILQARVGWARAAFGDAWPACTDDALIADVDVWLAPLLGRATGRADLQRVNMASVIRSRIGSQSRISTDLYQPRSSWPAAGAQQSPMTVSIRGSPFAPKTSTAPPFTRRSQGAGSQSRSRCFRPPGARSRSPATFRGSGAVAGRRCAGRWRRAIRATTGPMIRRLRSQDSAHAGVADPDGGGRV